MARRRRGLPLSASCSFASTSTWGGGTAGPPRASMGEAPPTDAGDHQMGDTSSPAIEAPPRRRQTRPSLPRRRQQLRAIHGSLPETAGRRGTAAHKKHHEELAVLAAAKKLNDVANMATELAAVDGSAVQRSLPRRQRHCPQAPPEPKQRRGRPCLPRGERAGGSARFRSRRRRRATFWKRRQVGFALPRNYLHLTQFQRFTVLLGQALRHLQLHQNY